MTVPFDTLGQLLVQSIMTNGWTLPIVVRPDYTIIDGFHRWTVAGEEPLHTKLGGKVPVVVVRHEDASEDIYGTVTHNRARGTPNGSPLSQYLFRSPSLFALQWPFLGLYASGKGTPKASTEASLRGSLRLSWAV